MTKIPPQELSTSIKISLDRIPFLHNINIQVNVKENKILITTDRNFQGSFSIHPSDISQLLNSPDITRFVSSANRNSSKNQNDTDYDLLQTFVHLNEGLWYHYVTIDEAKSLLKNSKEGTFLLRNSNHPSFIFTLTVATNAGVTNIRIGYQDGLFYLDCEERTRHKMPHFSDVVELIYFYSGRRLCGRDGGGFDVHRKRVESQPKCVWVDTKKRKYLPVQLTVPKLQSLPSLKHICRLRINSCIENKCEQLETKGLSVSAGTYRNQLHLPTDLKDYLKSYPYTI